MVWSTVLFADIDILLIKEELYLAGIQGLVPVNLVFQNIASDLVFKSEPIGSRKVVCSPGDAVVLSAVTFNSDFERDPCNLDNV